VFIHRVARGVRVGQGRGDRLEPRAFPSRLCLSLSGTSPSARLWGRIGSASARLEALTGSAPTLLLSAADRRRETVVAVLLADRRLSRSPSQFDRGPKQIVAGAVWSASWSLPRAERPTVGVMKCRRVDGEPRRACIGPALGVQVSRETASSRVKARAARGRPEGSRSRMPLGLALGRRVGPAPGHRTAVTRSSWGLPLSSCSQWSSSLGQHRSVAEPAHRRRCHHVLADGVMSPAA
jgi:hypothetical protein